jgi:hypothetical protein
MVVATIGIGIDKIVAQMRGCSRPLMREAKDDQGPQPMTIQLRSRPAMKTSLSTSQLGCGIEALAGEFRLKAPLRATPCGLLSLMRGCRIPLISFVIFI